MLFRSLLVFSRWHPLSVQCIPNLYTREFYLLVPPCYLAVSPGRCPTSSIKRPPQTHLGRVGNSRTNPSPNSRSYLQSSSTHLVGSRKNAYGFPPTELHRQDIYPLNPATATNRGTICQESRIRPTINGRAHQNQILRLEGLIFESVTPTGKTIDLWGRNTPRSIAYIGHLTLRNHYFGVLLPQAFHDFTIRLNQFGDIRKLVLYLVRVAALPQTGNNISPPVFPRVRLS